MNDLRSWLVHVLFFLYSGLWLATKRVEAQDSDLRNNCPAEKAWHRDVRLWQQMQRRSCPWTINCCRRCTLRITTMAEMSNKIAPTLATAVCTVVTWTLLRRQVLRFLFQELHGSLNIKNPGTRQSGSHDEGADRSVPAVFVGFIQWSPSHRFVRCYIRRWSTKLTSSPLMKRRRAWELRWSFVLLCCRAGKRSGVIRSALLWLGSCTRFLQALLSSWLLYLEVINMAHVSFTVTAAFAATHFIGDN